MEVFDGYFSNGLSALKDSIALNLNEAIDYSLTTLQNLLISNRNQGRLMVLVEEIKGQVQNIRDYMNIDQNQQGIDKTNARLIEIKQITEKKGNAMPQAERENLTREAKALLNRRTNALTRNRYLLDSIRARENQIEALQTKKQYESMVATQLMRPEEFKDIVADITLAQDTLDHAQEEMTNISETMYDTNTSKKDAVVIRQEVLRRSIPYFTTLSASRALILALDEMGDDSWSQPTALQDFLL
jgi:vacuolar-type H+-ATPase subunit I/STV1